MSLRLITQIDSYSIAPSSTLAGLSNDSTHTQSAALHSLQLQLADRSAAGLVDKSRCRIDICAHAQFNP